MKMQTKGQKLIDRHDKARAAMQAYACKLVDDCWITEKRAAEKTGVSVRTIRTMRALHNKPRKVWLSPATCEAVILALEV